MTARWRKPGLRQHFFLPPFLKPVICQRCDGGECQLETWDEGKTLSFWQQQQQKPNGSADPFDDTGEPGQTGWIDYFHLDVRTEANANETKVLTLFLESHLQLDPEWMHLVMWVQPCFSFSIQNHLKPTRSWNGSKTSDGCFLGHKTKKWFCQHLALPTAQASDCVTWPFPTEKWRIWFYFNAQSPYYVDFWCCAVLFLYLGSKLCDS